MSTNLTASDGRKKIFKPESIEESLQGWLLHAHKGRNRHDLAARRYDRIKIWLGGIATVISAVVASSAAISAAVPPDTVSSIKIVVAVIGTLSAIFIGLSTFLNLAERVEKHRSAGVRYKEIIRQIQRVLSSSSFNDQALIEIEKKLNDLEETAPVIPERIYDRVENDWETRGIKFVSSAEKLYVD